jgi:hypothetical protein
MGTVGRQDGLGQNSRNFCNYKTMRKPRSGEDNISVGVTMKELHCGLEGGGGPFQR